MPPFQSDTPFLPTGPFLPGFQLVKVLPNWLETAVFLAPTWGSPPTAPRRRSSLSRQPSSCHVLTMTEKEALLANVRFALLGLDPWPPKGSAVPLEDYARKVVDQLKLSGWQILRRPTSTGHSTP